MKILLSTIIAAFVFTSPVKANIIIDKVVETKIALEQGVEEAKSDINTTKNDIATLYNKLKGFAITGKELIINRGKNEEAQH